MSHELEMVNGAAQMAYTIDDGKPWHKLGVALDPTCTPQEMMKAAGLDWTVEKRENFHRNMDGEFVKSGNVSLIRSTDSKILTQISDSWNPVQNSEAFDFFTEFCKAGDMTMNSAGSLFDGKKIWALAKVASDFTVFGDDRVEGYLLFSNPHQYGQCVDVRFTPIRVVCNNTLSMSLGQEAKHFARFNHTKEFDSALAKEILGISTVRMEEYKEVAEFLGSKQINDAKYKEFLGKVFGTTKDGELKRNGKLAYEVFETQPGAEFARGSFWQALNSVTYITDHQLGRSAHKRVDNMWIGGVQRQKIKAVEIALQMAKA